ncbi:MAG: hypothetical protein JJT81_15095 [Rubellimicrobium sp.]|nr:hypothetical protein [Rubellimicrobium sp.]
MSRGRCRHCPSRTGIGALVVAAGELVHQFGRLVQGAGGFGAAQGLLRDVASEAWERMRLAMVRDTRAIAFQLAEVAVTGTMPRAILAAIRRLRAPQSRA